MMEGVKRQQLSSCWFSIFQIQLLNVAEDGILIELQEYLLPNCLWIISEKKEDKIKINQQQELKPDLPFLFSIQIWSQESQNHSQNEQPRITQNFIQQIYKWV